MGFGLHSIVTFFILGKVFPARYLRFLKVPKHSLPPAPPCSQQQRAKTILPVLEKPRAQSMLKKRKGVNPARGHGRLARVGSNFSMRELMSKRARRPLPCKMHFSQMRPYMPQSMKWHRHLAHAGYVSHGQDAHAT